MQTNDAEEMAPQVGLEPTTLRLTAECSAIELLRSVAGLTFDFHNIIHAARVKTLLLKYRVGGVKQLLRPGPRLPCLPSLVV